MSTRHDASKVLLGTVGTSDRVSTVEAVDPADFPAGIAVRRTNAGGLSTAVAAGRLIGVSLGASLSDTKKTSVCRVGDQVAIALKDEGEFSTVKIGDITFTAKAKGEAGDDITVTLLDDVDEGDESVEVDGTDITVHMEDGASTAQEIVDAIEASEDASALIGCEIDSGDEAVGQADAASTPLADGVDSYPYAVIGDPVLVDDVTGEASSDGTATGAIYVSESKDGVAMDGSIERQVALIDMGGGL